MRLKSIKLAGFKSFVDPTTVNFPSNLAAVVGPNGCGKSNIIDAVRWVMGESSAKNLRGENMTDVIFNGSGNRKPVGQASIELVFDNSDNRIKGEYASFAEISIKRKVSRDGTNMYMLNGTKCRRRDITDIFLGTGLGPRSYSIIEQGMVSRLIESKPEELRIFIEEAAGISKYKERRRDTENRIKRTRENMERLTDIRDELTRQLAHLHRQAQAAEKYKEYKAQERDLKAQYDALRWRALDTEVQSKQGVIKDLELQIESVVAEQRGLDAKHEELLLKHTDLNDELSEVQGRYYSLGGDIARIEQSIEHHIERLKQLRQDLDENQRNFQQSQTEAQVDVQKMAALEEELAVLEPELELAEHAQEESAIKLEDAEEQMQGWQQTWDEFSQRSEEPRQLAEVEQSRIQQLEKIVERGVERRSRLREERQTLGENPEQDAIDELSVQITAMEDQLDSKQTRNSELASQIEQERGQGQQLGHELDQARSELQRQKGQFSSLDALQKSALGQTDDKLNRWLKDKSLSERSRLGERIKVASGWEPAVEAVLGDTLQAVCVDDLDSVAGAMAELPSGVLSLLETGPLMGTEEILSASKETGAKVSPPSPLSGKITADFDISALLQGIYTADTLDQALAARKSLSGADSVVTPQGLWLGRNWIRVRKSVDASEGLLARKGEMSRLSEQMEILQQQADELLENQQASREALRDLEGERENVQREIAQISREYSELKSRLSAKIMKEEQTTQRRQRLQHELEELEKQLEVEQENIARSRENLQNALDAMEQDIERRETLMQQRDSLRGSLDQIRQQARHDKDQSHQLSVREQLLRSQITSMRDTMARMNTQVLRAKERIESIEKQLNESDMPLEGKRTELETLLQNRLEVEDKMNAAKAAADENEHQLRALEQERAGFERKAGGLREQLMEHRLKTEGDLVKREALSEQLKDARYDLDTVLANLPDDLTQQSCEDELEAIGNRVQRLGAINLAAIEEYEQQSERKVYLDAQNDDLERALLTLENAIRKIDRETRTRFKETFDKINAGLQELFPKVFGGGHAYLDMTGDDLLDTGVAIMARPPGKRNSTIHLLSGGEKAMTAIALVFSIFRLNPSPFCMLDEVDAPLDDANVGRYGRLVKEMSDTVQFVFITHNKLTMEIANQLLGVTMHEPGVSRIVAVDIEEAAELAAM
ncbi:chromosome segregation protein SMC [Pseudohongiella sp.]|uniref:SMC hinge domain-containing protein n=1 Tax=marine sediment metagenome TaxID=412755 RepID=A0A0F9YHW9_9ZZZZ|nr:chromosome segregation protein SMC [Pseudohongiella sp.]HDZ08961.1 chromosome segregation protein SMC [Pseudohongiella sp.]HEA62646.1 chromosome segregation protein SMC [Pseudohongiella sp.]